MSLCIVSVDPGVQHFGAALWSKGRDGYTYLVRAARIDFSDRNAAPHLFAYILPRDVHDFTLVIEKPQVYRRSRSKGDPNDLIDVAITVGACSTLTPTVIFYKPSEWKGQIEKPKRKSVPYPVEERCREQLSPVELARIDLPRDWKKRMDVWDAIGIGLKYFKSQR